MILTEMIETRRNESEKSDDCQVVLFDIKDIKSMKVEEGATLQGSLP